MKVNYQSDFKIVEKNMNGDEHTPFKFAYYTITSKNIYATYDGTEYRNCKRLPDGTLLVAFDNHGLRVGSLMVRREYFLTDADFKDGICNLVSVEDTGVKLTTGQSDDSTGTVYVYPNYQKGDKGDTGTQGLKGDKGDAMTWADMSQPQKDELRDSVVAEMPEGLTKIDAYKVISTGAFIENPSLHLKVQATARRVSVFEIKDMYNVNVHIPKDGNQYSVTYAYADADVWVTDTPLLAPEQVIVGSGSEKNLVIQNTGNHRFVVVAWDGAVTPTANAGSFNEQIRHTNARISSIPTVDVVQERMIRSMTNNKRSDIQDKLRPVKVLWIGNSFADLSTKNLGKLFEKLGYQITMGVSYKGAATLEYYDTNKDTADTQARYLKYKGGQWVIVYDDAVNNTLMDKLNDENWDIVFFQQGSASSGLYSTYQPYFNSLQEWLPSKIQSLGYKTGWLMPWAWSTKRITEVGGNLDGGATMDEMYANISQATQSLMAESGQYIDLLCPCGTAVQNQLNYYSQDVIYGVNQWADGQHPMTEGFYASTCMLFEKIANYLFNKGLEDITWDSSLGVTADIFNYSKASALNAKWRPYEFLPVPLS